MSFPRRVFDRALIAKLSDARERLHALIENASPPRAPEAGDRTRADATWPRDINENAPPKEERHG